MVTVDYKALSKLEKPIRDDRDPEITCYCPNCEKLVKMVDSDVKCPYWDPYCFHMGYRCENCNEGYDFLEGYKTILRYNREKIGEQEEQEEEEEDENMT